MAYPQQPMQQNTALNCHHTHTHHGGKHRGDQYRGSNNDQDQKRALWDANDQRQRSIYQDTKQNIPQQQPYQNDYYSQQQQQQQQRPLNNNNFSNNYGQQAVAQTQYTASNNTPLNSNTLAPVDNYASFHHMKNDELKLEAKIKYKTAIFKARRSFKPKQLLLENGAVANGGVLVFSMDNEHLELIGGDCNQHFNMKEGTNAIGKNDLVKSIKIRATGNYDKELVLSFPTVDALPDEITRGLTKYINHTIDAGALSNGKVYEAKVAKRFITNGIVAFATSFADATPDTMANSITFRQHLGHCLLPLMHPVVYHYNKDHETDGLAITEKDVIPGLEHQEIRMSYDAVMHYLDVAKANISQKVSLGNVTTDMCVIVAAAPPTTGKKANFASNAGGGEAKVVKEFGGFCDVDYHVGKGASAQVKQDFLKTPTDLNITIQVKFVKLDGRPLELDC